MSTMVIEGLRAAVGGQEILSGVDLVIESGEVHAVMGPNGSGKSTLSHVIAGRPGYEVLAGSVRICLLYTSPSPRDVEESRMPSSA